MPVICSAAKDLPLDQGSAWNGAAAEASLFAAAGYPDHPDPAKAARGFLCWDNSAGDKQSSFHLPFAKVVEGKLTAVAAGIRAAASRLPQTDGVPDDVKAKARAVITAYEARMGSGDNARPAAEDDLAGLDDENRGQLTIFQTRAPLLRASEIALPDQEKVALDPDIFAQNPPYTFRAQISNNQMDAYYTRMAPSTLKNYAADAQDGVAFQNSHRSDELPMGRSFAGKYIGPQGDNIAKTHADFYVLPGLKLNEVHSDDLIRGIRGGIVKDVSVGFYGGKFRCTLCGRDMLSDWQACEHIPGISYKVRSADDTGEEEKPAAAWVEDAHLAEVSGVYDGATPGAAILKGRCLSEAGRLAPAVARLLESRYRIRLPASQPRWAGAAFPRHEEPDMAENRGLDSLTGTTAAGLSPTTQAGAGMPAAQDPSANLPEATTRALEAGSAVRGLLQEAGIEAGADLLAGVRWLVTDWQRLKELARESEALRALADEGRQYRSALVEDALAEGVRALGSGFDRPVYEQMFATTPLALIRTMRDTWAREAALQFPGGRVTVDVAAPPPGDRPPAQVPDSAYSA